MATIPNILHQTWPDENLPPDLAAMRQTWLCHHPAWESLLWTDLGGRRFIKHHYSWFLHLYDRYPREIMRVDAVRYFLLYHYGGVYADLDMECLRSVKTHLPSTTGMAPGGGRKPRQKPIKLRLQRHSWTDQCT